MTVRLHSTALPIIIRITSAAQSHRNTFKPLIFFQAFFTTAFTCCLTLMEVQGWCSGESTHLPPTRPQGSIPRLGVIMWVELLLVFYSAPTGFSPGTPVFPSSQKPTLDLTCVNC